MKWLVIVLFLFGFTTPLTANENSDTPDNIVHLPSNLTCGPYNPEINLETKYGELAFVSGIGEVLSPDRSKSYQGTMEMFVDPNDYSWTIILHLGKVFSCLVMSGEMLTPLVKGDAI